MQCHAMPSNAMQCDVFTIVYVQQLEQPSFCPQQSPKIIKEKTTFSHHLPKKKNMFPSFSQDRLHYWTVPSLFHCICPQLPSPRFHEPGGRVMELPSARTAVGLRWSMAWFKGKSKPETIDSPILD